MDLASLFDVGAFTQAFSSNVYVSGLIMILLNAGSSYLMQDLTPITHRIFSSVWVRRLVFFAIFFTATRDLKVSIVLMIVFTLLVDLFLNEDSQFCLIPYEYRQKQSVPPQQSSLQYGAMNPQHQQNNPELGEQMSSQQPQSTPHYQPQFESHDTEHFVSHMTHPYSTQQPTQQHTQQQSIQQQQNLTQQYQTSRFETFKKNAEKWTVSKSSNSNMPNW